jgi:hypothetical protein
MTKEDFIKVDRAVQKAIETGDWEPTGVKPKKSCKCNSTGKLGYLVGAQRYLVCCCVAKLWPIILKYIKLMEGENANVPGNVNTEQDPKAG